MKTPLIVCPLTMRYVFIGILIVIVVSSNAAPIDGITEGKFVDPDIGPDSVVTGVGTSRFTWGTPDGTVNPSSLEFFGEFFSTDTDLEEIIPLGTLEYFNGSVVLSTVADAVDVDLEIAFDNPAGVTRSLVQKLTLENTENVGTPEQNADIVVLPTAIPEVTFNREGVENRLEFIGFGSVGGEGFVSTVDRFHVLEGASASAQLLGRFTASPGAGFQLSDKVVPGIDKRLYYKFSMSEILPSGEFAIGVTLHNANEEDVSTGVCMMANVMGNKEDHPKWFASVKDVNGESQWVCEQSGNVDWNPSYHFGCREFVIPTGQSVYWFDTGTLPPSANRLTPYIDFLRPFPIDASCQSSSVNENVRGENQFLIPEASVGRERYANYWSLMQHLETFSPLGCTVTWPTGNWFTMGNPDTYPARLEGTIIDAPSGSEVMFRAPTQSGEEQQTFVVQPTDLNNPSCLGQREEVSIPFIIQPGPGEMTMEVQVPDACSELREGSVIRFNGRAVAEPGSPNFLPDEFIVGHAASCVLDNTPPSIDQFEVVAQNDGTVLVKVTASDSVVFPLMSALDVDINGMTEQVLMGFADPPTDGQSVFFEQILGPFSPSASFKAIGTVGDEVGNRVQTSQEEVEVNFACDCASPDAVIGKPTADSIIGTDGDDIICSLGGDDRIVTGDGNDCIDSGDGNDSIVSGMGSDQVIGGLGDDRIDTSGDADVIIAGEGDDVIMAGDGDDRIFAGPGEDRINGENGLDICEDGELVVSCE